MPRPPQPRFISRDGSSNPVVRLGQPDPWWSDTYNRLLTLSWSQTLLLISLLYLAVNGGFALLYLVDPDSVGHVQRGSFWDAFFFSVQTLGTIGYGVMYPQDLYGNIIVTIEELAGLLGVAMATGLMFAKLSRPTARVLFSTRAVVTLHNGIPTLMFRAANQRRNQIVEAQVTATIVRNEMTIEGGWMRRFYDLTLTRSRSPIFSLTWTLMHPIDENSPLYGLTAALLEQVESEIVITLTGIDDTFAQVIHTRYSYIAPEISWNARFVDIIGRTPDGRRQIDFTQFHEVIPALSDQGSDIVAPTLPEDREDQPQVLSQS